MTCWWAAVKPWCGQIRTQVRNARTRPLSRKDPRGEALNSLGDSGWELVYAYTNRDLVNYVFKPCVHEVTVDRR